MTTTTYKPTVLTTFGCSTEIDDLDKSACIFIDGLWLDHPDFKSAECKVLVQGCEPPEIFREFYTIDDLIEVADQFDLILCADERLSQLPNAKIFPFGSCWISKDYKNFTKRFELSHIVGWKTQLAGHKLRHQIRQLILPKVNNIPQKIYFRPDPEGKFESNGKDKCFDTSQFALIIENTQHRNYFTEKIIDCFATKTIPLYWGCPNIDDFFDSTGIIRITNLEDCYKKILALSPDIYDNKIDVIEDNCRRAQQYRNLNQRIHNEITQL
tara:strand:+ start:1620 stop:2426 length:807 start_codon:yes stop_codon:yes gene_type:complete